MAEQFADETDPDLLRRHLAGDRDAFGEIVRRHRDQLWAVALRTTGNAEDAADAVQDGLISAMRHADGFRGEAKVSTWLHRIVVNACLDRLRGRAAHPTVALPDDEQAPASGRAISRSAGSDDAYATRDTALDVQQALARLPHEQRVALVLVDIEGYPVDEVAAMLAVPSGTVKSRCARGRARLAPMLAYLRADPARPDGNPARADGVEPPMTAPREDLR